MRRLCLVRSSAVAVAAAAVAALAAPAATGASTATPRGTYGGVTGQGFPVIVDVSRTGRLVVRVLVAVRLSCTSGSVATLPDAYQRLTLSKTGHFRASFGPQTERRSDGTTSDFQGSMTGAFNAARTKVSGKWSLTFTDHDGTGAVTDTCSLANVSWSAEQ